MELVQRNQYIKLLKKKLKFKEDLHTYVCLIENQMQMKEYEQVLKSLKEWIRSGTEMKNTGYSGSGIT